MCSVVVVDTNCLLDSHQRSAVLGLKYYSQLLVVVPFIVLQELDGIKSGDGNKAYDARKAVQFLSDEVSHDNIWIRGQCFDELPSNSNKLLSKNDDQILKCCLYFKELVTQDSGNSPHDVLLVTMDRVLQVKAKSHHISSLDCIALRNRLTESWQETVRLGTDIYFKDGMYCSPTPSSKTHQQQSQQQQQQQPQQQKPQPQPPRSHSSRPIHTRAITSSSSRLFPQHTQANVLIAAPR